MIWNDFWVDFMVEKSTLRWQVDLTDKSPDSLTTSFYALSNEFKQIQVNKVGYKKKGNGSTNRILDIGFR